MRILVTRPAADAQEFKERLTALGHEVLIDPLMRIETCAPESLETRGLAAVVATSRNALRAVTGHGQLAELLRLPLFTVGPGTAAAAQQLGFADIRQGAGTAAELVGPIRTLAGGRTEAAVLHLRGEKIAFDLAAALAGHGIALRDVVVYRQVAAGVLAGTTTDALRNGNIDIIVLMSPLTAATWIKLVEAAGLRDAAARLGYACLSAGIAGTVAALGAETYVAVKPSAEEMLALLSRVAAQSTGTEAADRQAARPGDVTVPGSRKEDAHISRKPGESER